MALVQHWKLDDNAANTTVVATVGNNGTLTGGDNTSAKASTGPGGSITWSFDLNGTDDYVDVTAAAFDLSGTWSVGVWVSPDSVSANAVLGRSASQYRNIYITNSTTISLETSWDIWAFTVPTMSTGTWYFIFAYKDASNNIRLYLNGTQSSTGAKADSSGSFTVDAIGRSRNGYFNGKISQVRLWNTDESASISTLYAEGVTAAASGNHWNYYAQCS